MRHCNRDQLIMAARLLRPMLKDLVFVGGCTTALLITDEAAPEVRPTYDVDAIAEVTSYAEYTEFSERLRDLGFTEDAREGSPLCRWVQAEVTLDVMPPDTQVLGFSNVWYPAAVARSVEMELEAELPVRIITAPYFVATKLVAHNNRGRGDYFGSHDLEDIVSVVDGRAKLVAEVCAEPDNLRAYVGQQCERLLDDDRFLDALPGYLMPDDASQARVSVVIDRFKQLTALRT